jgi:hypothetical protein
LKSKKISAKYDLVDNSFFKVQFLNFYCNWQQSKNFSIFASETQFLGPGQNLFNPQENTLFALCEHNFCLQGTWKWTDGSAWDYSHWLAGEPNGGTKENCLEVYKDSKWSDAPCDVSKSYVCKIVK